MQKSPVCYIVQIQQVWPNRRTHTSALTDCFVGEEMISCWFWLCGCFSKIEKIVRGKHGTCLIKINISIIKLYGRAVNWLWQSGMKRLIHDAYCGVRNRGRTRENRWRPCLKLNGLLNRAIVVVQLLSSPVEKHLWGGRRQPIADTVPGTAFFHEKVLIQINCPVLLQSQHKPHQA